MMSEIVPGRLSVPSLSALAAFEAAVRRKIIREIALAPPRGALLVERIWA